MLDTNLKRPEQNFDKIFKKKINSKLDSFKPEYNQRSLDLQIKLMIKEK